MNPTRTAATALAAALAALLVAGCSGGAGGAKVATLGDGSGAPAPTASKDPAQQMLAFTKCMREHGIDLPDPGENGMIGVDRNTAGGPGTGTGQPLHGPGEEDEFRAADAACRHHMAGAVRDLGGSVDPAEQDRLLKFARCMREHGVPMPDPTFDTGNVEIRLPDGLRPDDPKVAAAHEACKEFFGAGGTGGGPGSGPGVAPVPGGPGGDAPGAK